MEKSSTSITIVMFGFENTGKTTLINSIINPEKKTIKYIPTVGAELKYGLVETELNNKKYSIKIKFIEIAGQWRFRSLISPKMAKKGDILIFVFNSNDEKSFDKIKDIYINCFDYDQKIKPLCFLLCNKVDIVQDVENSELKDEILEFCEENNLIFLTCTSFIENCSDFYSKTDCFTDKNNIFKNLLKTIVLPTYYKNKIL